MERKAWKWPEKLLKFLISLVTSVTGTSEVRDACSLVFLVLNKPLLVEVDVSTAFGSWFELYQVENVLHVVEDDF